MYNVSFSIIIIIIFLMSIDQSIFSDEINFNGTTESQTLIKAQQTVTIISNNVLLLFTLSVLPIKLIHNFCLYYLIYLKKMVVEVNGLLYHHRLLNLHIIL